MTDAEYLFKQDIKEKKAAGRGAFNKKGGSRSKKCTLPSDYMTKKEREKMNGEVIAWSPNQFYTWEEFKAFPNSVQKEYLKALCEKYRCGVNNVVSGIFGDAVANNLSNYMKRRGWDRAEFGKSIRGTGAARLKRRIQEDVERAHSQIDKFNEKWGLTEETGEETDISENEEIAAEEEIQEVPVETELMDGEITREEYYNSIYTAVMHSEERYGSDTMLMLNHINNAVAWANRTLRLKNYLFLNDMLSTLHISAQPIGKVVGWSANDKPDISWCRLEQKGDYGLVFDCHPIFCDVVGTLHDMDEPLEKEEEEEKEPEIEETVESEIVPENNNVITHMEIDMNKFDLEKLCIIRSMFDPDAEFDIHISIDVIE